MLDLKEASSSEIGSGACGWERVGLAGGVAGSATGGGNGVTGRTGGVGGTGGGFGGSGDCGVAGVRIKAAGDLEALRSRARRATSIGVFSGAADPSRTAELLRVCETFLFLAIAVDSRMGRLFLVDCSLTALGLNAVSGRPVGIAGDGGCSFIADDGRLDSASIETDRCRRIRLSLAGLPLVTICSDVSEGERDFGARYTSSTGSGDAEPERDRAIRSYEESRERPRSFSLRTSSGFM